MKVIITTKLIIISYYKITTTKKSIILISLNIIIFYKNISEIFFHNNIQYSFFEILCFFTAIYWQSANHSCKMQKFVMKVEDVCVSRHFPITLFQESPRTNQSFKPLTYSCRSKINNLPTNTACPVKKSNMTYSIRELICSPWNCTKKPSWPSRTGSSDSKTGASRSLNLN